MSHSDFEHHHRPAYKAMWRHARYRLVWIDPPSANRDAKKELDAEVESYVRDLWEREESWRLTIGVRGGGDLAVIYAIEAAHASAVAAQT